MLAHKTEGGDSQVSRPRKRKVLHQGINPAKTPANRPIPLSNFPRKKLKKSDSSSFVIESNEPDVFSTPTSTNKMSKVTWKCENIRREKAGLPLLPPLPRSPSEALDKVASGEDDDGEEESSSSDSEVDLSDIQRKVAKSSDPTEVDLDEYESDFIDDSEQPDCQPPADSLNLSCATKEIVDYVEDVIEYLVFTSLLIFPPRDEKVYEIAFKKLNKESKGLAESEFSSSIWAPKFALALQGYPTIRVRKMRPLEITENLRCHACKNPRWVKYAIYFGGLPYERDFHEIHPYLCPVFSGIPGTYTDSEGHVLPLRTAKWKVGKTCMENALLGSHLRHWAYHLKKKVQAHLYNMGVLPSSRQFGLSSDPSYVARATTIYNDLFEDGVVKEWIDWYRNLMRDARRFQHRRIAETADEDSAIMNIFSHAVDSEGEAAANAQSDEAADESDDLDDDDYEDHGVEMAETSDDEDEYDENEIHADAARCHRFGSRRTGIRLCELIYESDDYVDHGVDMAETTDDEDYDEDEIHADAARYHDFGSHRTGNRHCELVYESD